MDYLKVSDAGTAPFHQEEPRSVAVDYAHVAEARNKALQAFSMVDGVAGAGEDRLARLEGCVQELGDAVLALVGVLTEVVSGLDCRDLHVINYPSEDFRVPRSR